MKLDIHSGENTRPGEVFGEQAKTYVCPEFKQQAASLVVDKNYSAIEASVRLVSLGAAVRRLHRLIV